MYAERRQSRRICGARADRAQRRLLAAVELDHVRERDVGVRGNRDAVARVAVADDARQRFDHIAHNGRHDRFPWRWIVLRAAHGDPVNGFAGAGMPAIFSLSCAYVSPLPARSLSPGSWFTNAVTPCWINVPSRCRSGPSAE